MKSQKGEAWFMFAIAVSVALSIVIMAIVAVLSGKQKGAKAISAVAAGAFCLSCLLFSQALLLQCLLTFIAALIAFTLPLGKRRNWLIGSAILAAVTSIGLQGIVAHSKLSKLERLRAQFPIVSVSERLERLHPTVHPEQLVEPAHVRLGEEAEQTLAARESKFIQSYRRYDLLELHQRERDEFVIAQGFGYSRMSNLHHANFELAPVPSNRLPTPDQIEEQYKPAENELQPIVTKPPRRRGLLTLHTGSLFDFLDPDRLGSFESRECVIGFEPHAFSEPPQIPRDDQPTGSSWHTTRLELVSLLKHDQPMAYVSQNLPRMDELQSAPTRPLVEFEAAALQQLKAGEEIVILEDEHGIRMLGAVRAANDCLICHTARRGELLGAFSYDLTPIPPQPQRSTTEKANPTDEPKKL